MNRDKGSDVSDPALTTPDDSADRERHVRQRYPMAGPSDAEKYRWLRANRGNFAIVEALDGSDRDADFDDRIEAEMRMSAAGRDSYRTGLHRLP